MSNGRMSQRLLNSIQPFILLFQYNDEKHIWSTAAQKFLLLYRLQGS